MPRHSASDSQPEDDWDSDWDDDWPEDSDEPGVVECPECHSEVYEDLEYCPQCGYFFVEKPGSRSAFAGKPIWYVLLAIAGIVAVIGTFLWLI